MSSSRKRAMASSGSESESEGDAIALYKGMYDEMKEKMAAMEKLLMKQMSKSRRKRRKTKREKRENEADHQTSSQATPETNGSASRPKRERRKRKFEKSESRGDERENRFRMTRTADDQESAKPKVVEKEVKEMKKSSDVEARDRKDSEKETMDVDEKKPKDERTERQKMLDAAVQSIKEKLAKTKEKKKQEEMAAKLKHEQEDEKLPKPKPQSQASSSMSVEEKKDTEITNSDVIEEEVKPRGGNNVAEEEEKEEGEGGEDFKLWKSLKKDPSDFDSWVQLASSLEKKDDYTFLRKVLKGLLQEYPLCYGYWTKLAELEKRNGRTDLQLQVAIEGIKKARHCHEMWTYYCCMHFDAKDDEIIAQTRRRFAEAAEVVGNDLQSHSFWNKYIEFETLQEDYNRVTGVYLKILSIPLSMLDEYYKRFQEFAANRPLKDLLSEAEGKSFNPTSVTESEKYRQEIMKRHEELYLTTCQVKNVVNVFENRITRAYFHVKELSEGDITNWNAYLDYCEKWTQQAPEQYERTVKLYERCLVACANYPEFWNRYAKFVAHNAPVKAEESARSILTRAISVFTKRQPGSYLEFALFEEEAGQISHARDLYKTVITSISPGLVEAIVSYAHFERRQGNSSTADEILLNGMAKAEGEDFVSLAITRANLHLSANDLKKAREIYDESLQKVTGDIRLWLSYITMEINQSKSDFQKIKNLYDKGLSSDSKLSEKVKEALAGHFLDFATMRGTSVKLIRQIQYRYPSVTSLYASEEKKMEEDVFQVQNSSKLVQSQPTAKMETEPEQQAQQMTQPQTQSQQQQRQQYSQQDQTGTADYYQQYGYSYPQYQGYDYSQQQWYGGHQ